MGMGEYNLALEKQGGKLRTVESPSLSSGAPYFSLIHVLFFVTVTLLIMRNKNVSFLINYLSRSCSTDADVAFTVSHFSCLASCKLVSTFLCACRLRLRSISSSVL